MKLKTALFVGRFQPLHKGHVFAIRRLFEKYRKVVIAVGSINKNNAENPFSFKERKAMLNAVLIKWKNRYKIIGAPDVSNDAKWGNAIIRKAKFDVVVTANPWTQRCFHGYKIVKPNTLNPRKYNATKIRKLIREDKNWQSLVPKQIVPIIKKHFSKQ